MLFGVYNTYANIDLNLACLVQANYSLFLDACKFSIKLRQSFYFFLVFFFFKYQPYIYFMFLGLLWLD